MRLVPLVVVVVVVRYLGVGYRRRDELFVWAGVAAWPVMRVLLRWPGLNLGRCFLGERERSAVAA